jgi:hypothetical protein
MKDLPKVYSQEWGHSSTRYGYCFQDNFKSIGQDIKGKNSYIVRSPVFLLSAFMESLRVEEVQRILRSYFIELN